MEKRVTRRNFLLGSGAAALGLGGAGGLASIFPGRAYAETRIPPSGDKSGKQDTKRLQDAIDKGAKNIVLSNGVFYVLPRGLNLNKFSGGTLRGASTKGGRRTLLQRAGRASGIQDGKVQAHAFISSVPLRNVRIENLTVEGRRGEYDLNANKQVGGAIRFALDNDKYNSKIVLRGVRILDWPGVAIFCDNMKDALVVGCEILNPARGGYVFLRKSRFVEIRGNKALRCGDDAIALNTQYSSKISAPYPYGFKIERNELSVRRDKASRDGACIALRGARGTGKWNLVYKNDCRYGQHAGIYIGDDYTDANPKSHYCPANVHVVANRVSHSQRDGIEVRTADSVHPKTVRRGASKIRIVGRNEIIEPAGNGISFSKQTGVRGDIHLGESAVSGNSFAKMPKRSAKTKIGSGVEGVFVAREQK
ncbi:MAG: right-handed parallel beta-helix repeat-containing protein [Actinomycetota bacterium]|nr:right-handed parallel beta-helix repeat-containing protein [Actinomycetota bacterium]